MALSFCGIRVFTPFAGQWDAVVEAANNYSLNPVHVPLSVALVNPSNQKFRIIRDNIVAAIVGTEPRSEDGSINILRAKVVEGSKHIKTVPIPSRGNSNSAVEVLCDGDDLTIIVDAIYGDAVILRITGFEDAVEEDAEPKGREVDLDDLTSILPRLELPAGYPDSSGDPIDWDTFITTYDNDVFQEDGEEDGNGPDGDGDGSGNTGGGSDGNGDGNGGA